MVSFRGLNNNGYQTMNDDDEVDVEEPPAAPVRDPEPTEETNKENWDGGSMEEEIIEEEYVEEGSDDNFELVDDDDDDDEIVEEEELARGDEGDEAFHPTESKIDTENNIDSESNIDIESPEVPPNDAPIVQTMDLKETDKKAPTPPDDDVPEQAPQRLRSPSQVQQPPAENNSKLPKSAVDEATEDQCLSSLQGLVVIGVLLFLAAAAIAIGTGLGVAKPFEAEPVAPTITPATPSFTPTPSIFPTFAPVPISVEDEELLSLWESVVGTVLYDQGTPYYEAAQWMLYRDPSRVNRRIYQRLRQRRQLQDNSTTYSTPADYTEEDLNYIQRYLLVFLYFATTNNGRRQWVSCNPVRPEYTEEDCMYSKAIRKLPSQEIQYETIPWKRWLSGADECDWAGVTCTTTSQNRLAVSAIDLGGQGLEGPMDQVVELMNLPELKSLAFAFNQIFGGLESALETLDSLDLTDNFLQGPLIRLGGLSSLTLEGNVFTGTLPVELFQFTTPLKFLNLGRNRLQGQIPPEASYALQLTSLQLHENLLDGTIPPELGQLPLRSLRLNNNAFTGTIPLDNVNVNWYNTLEEFWLFNNQLTGEIPTVLGTIPRMTDLRLSNNRLIGGMPTELNALSRLFRLEMAGNQLSGGLDASISSKLTNLEVMDVSGNQFSGPIVLDSQLINLQTLHLEFNQFTGDVPQSLCDISTLQVLTSDCLPVSGVIPNPCSCCTACCSTATGTCADPNGNPLPVPTQAPTVPPNSAAIDGVQAWAQEEFGDTIDQSPGSPHSLTSIWIATADSYGLTPADAGFTQRYVLALFYFTTRTWKSCNPASTTSCLYEELVKADDGSFSYVPTPAVRWLAPVSECEWVGVTCTDAVATSIDLLGQEINGALPTELATLSSLDTIKLAYNNFTGTIPSIYGQLLSLNDFQVQGNSLTGSMPTEICQLSTIDSLQADCDEIECTCCTECCLNQECSLALGLR